MPGAISSAARSSGMFSGIDATTRRAPARILRRLDDGAHREIPVGVAAAVEPRKVQHQHGKIEAAADHGGKVAAMSASFAQAKVW